MKRKTALPELLAPAGSRDAFYAAIHAGADAVYIGAPDFNARAYSDRMNAETLAELISYAHRMGRRVYVALNTLVYDKERELFLAAAREVRDAGADAAIVADFGMASLLSREIPELALHASTQMSVHSALGAAMLGTLAPVTRVVPARELPLSEIRTLVEEGPLPVEVFLHGALCVSHSGQCLFSSLVGGRSGNRGECAQPCRLPYSGGYPLSLRDLSLASHITELVDAGVASLKIEGRMKSPAYVYTVTSVYRRLLDEGRNATEEEAALLSRAFSRGGFTDGYFTDRKQSPMTGVRSEGDKADSRAIALPDTTPRKTPVSARLSICKDLPATLSLTTDRHTVTVAGETPTAAEKLPLTAEDVKSRLQKMGSTPFTLSADAIALTLDEGLYLTPAALNALRRSATDALLLCDRAPRGGEAPPASPAWPKADTEPPLLSGKRRSAYCHDPALLSVMPADCEAYIPLWRLREAKCLPDGVSIPPVLFDSELPAIRALLSEAASRGVTRAICDNIAAVSLAREAGLTPVGGFRLNVTNRESAVSLRKLGLADITLSPELSLPQCRDIGGRAIVYGHIPLMLLERCFMKENFSCDACNRAVLTDRTGARFPLVREYPHRNLLLNHIPTYMGDKSDELPRSVRPHFLFMKETPAEASRVFAFYDAGRPLPTPVRRIGKTVKKPDRPERPAGPEKPARPAHGARPAPTKPAREAKRPPAPHSKKNHSNRKGSRT